MFLISESKVWWTKVQWLLRGQLPTDFKTGSFDHMILTSCGPQCNLLKEKMHQNLIILQSYINHMLATHFLISLKPLKFYFSH